MPKAVNAGRIHNNDSKAMVKPIMKQAYVKSEKIRLALRVFPEPSVLATKALPPELEHKTDSADYHKKKASPN